MKLKLTYQRPGGASSDLLIECEALTTVGQLAEHLQAADPLSSHRVPSGTPTLALESGHQQLLRPEELVAESALHSGGTVSLAPAPERYSSAERERDAAARLTVLSGPDAGREFPLFSGSSTIGREHGCDVRLTDPLVSRRHARLNVGEQIEIIDQGSANGIDLAGSAVERATVAPGEVVTLGETSFTVIRVGRHERYAGALQFIRPARVAPIYAGREFEAPAPPDRPSVPRFPTVALVAPIVMGAVLYLVTHQIASLIFIGLSPLMMVGNAAEGRIVGRRDFARAVEAFNTDLRAMLADVQAGLERERDARLSECPSAADALAAAHARSEVLWSRRPDLPNFAQLRLGLGRAASRSSIQLPNRSRAPYELVQQLEQAMEPLATVDGVPITGDLQTGAVGVAGPRAQALAAARGLVTQAAALHSPAELVIAGVFSADAAADWEWAKWLPHTTSGQSPFSGRPLAATNEAAATLLTELEQLIEQRQRRPGTERSSLPLILMLLDDGARLAAHNRLAALAETGPPVGVAVLWIAAERTQLPAACKLYLQIPADGAQARAGYVNEAEEVTPVAVEHISAEQALEFARALAPVDDAAAPHRDDSDLPRTISQFALLGDSSLGSQPEAVLERWRASGSILTGPYAPDKPLHRAGQLRAVIGMGATGPHALDLRLDGPHALVGGSTNSGKSELLQSWILALAATYSPERVNFLLVDYKGGAAFADCVALPHTIGLVTDLSPHMVQRALTSLSAELFYREQLLREHNAKDLLELEKHGIPGAPPSLIIVVDEFATLVKEVPEFIDGVVNVAARGRSLGLHLILATQQPAGVIRGSLRANTNLRIALRVTDEADSDDVIGAPDAAAFDPSLPGRAVSRSGPTRLVPFQTAYAGGWTSDDPEPPALRVEELSLAAPAVWDAPDAAPVIRDRDQTDIKRLVAMIAAANQAAEIPEPRKAWLPVLPPTVEIATLPRSRRDDELVFALGDDPARQRQPPVAFHPDREGNLAVYGTGGSGKSTLLRALAITAGFSQRGGPCQVYGLDFGSRALQMLEALPHVGSIVAGDDGERVIRLITWLRALVDERAARYAEVKAGTITEYRTLAQAPDEARILLLIDNIGAFRQAYEAGRQRYADMLTSIAGEGRPVGVHLIIAASERIAINTTLSSAIQRRLVMRLANDDEYGMLGAAPDILDSSSPAGRAIDGDQEIQVAILGDRRDDASQAQRLDDLAQALRASGVATAQPIASLPTVVGLGDLPSRPQEVVIGVGAETLGPAAVQPRGGFLVTGPPGSGRSTCLRTIFSSLRRSMPDAELHYFGGRRSTLGTQEGWTSVSVTPDQIGERAQALAQRISQSDGDGSRFVVVTEAAGDLVMSGAEGALQALVRACIAHDHWFIAEGEVSTLRSSSGFLGQVKSSRCGIALAPDQETGATLFTTPFPRAARSEFPEGRGYLVGSGSVSVVQCALPD